MFGPGTNKDILEYVENIFSTVREPLITLDQNFKVLAVSRSFCNVFKLNVKNTIGKIIYELDNEQWDIPELRELLEITLLQDTRLDDYAIEHYFSTLGRRTMLFNVQQVRQVGGS
jgi:PAS domain-containing protein